MSPSQLSKATLTCNGELLNCQFNPTTLKITKQSRWQPHPAPKAAKSGAKQSQFLGNSPVTLSAQLLFDDSMSLPTPGPGAGNAVEALLAWISVPKDKVSSRNPQPMPVTFRWGDGVDFTGFLQSVNVTYSMFDPKGKPIRATVDIQLQLVPDSVPGQNPTSSGPPGRASEVLRDGDSLASIAHKHYGDPNLWRAIAMANGIDDPRRTPIGTRLLVPAHTSAVALSAPGAEL